ncbi:MAG: hypothetical protein AB7S38_18695 [Vulcanimicrobiota bacterium]
MISPIRAIAAREVAWKSAIAGAIARVDDGEALNGATYSDVLARRNEEETKHPSLATYLRRMTQIGFVPKLKDAKRDQDTEAKKPAEEETVVPFGWLLADRTTLGEENIPQGPAVQDTTVFSTAEPRREETPFSLMPQEWNLCPGAGTAERYILVA